MHKMTEHELLATIQQAESAAIVYNSEIQSINERLLKDYNGDPYGDEVEDRSQVTSTDVADVVESDMPALARIFLGSQRPLVFGTNSVDPRAEKEAEEKTVYINHLIHDQPNSFDTIFKWMKDAEMQKAGVLKYMAEETECIEYVEHENISEVELVALEESLQGEDVKDIVVESRTEEVDGLFDVSFKVVRSKQEFKFYNMAGEQFIISQNANSKDDAEIVGDMMERTRGDLVAMGFDRDLVDTLPSAGSAPKKSSIDYIRDKKSSVGTSAVKDWASEPVEVRDLYVKVDYDGDGIAERRHILKAGNTILINEPFDHVPYAILCGIPLPHRVIGKCRAELAQKTQRVKTALMRQILDNIYSVNNPRTILHPDVNIDDVLTNRHGGVVRLKNSTAITPQAAVMPLVTPYIGDKALQVLQYVDASRAQQTGVNAANQGLDADSIAKETATRFMGVREDSQAKIELVARNFAETGFKQLYEGIAWFASRYQNTEQELRILGKELTVNPSSWKYNTHVISRVGLGSGGSQQMTQALQGIYAIQQQLAQTGSPLSDQVKVHNTLKEITESLGFKDSKKFFNDPEQPEQLLQAENEMLKQAVKQLQANMQQLQAQAQNPLSEAEKIKAQAKLIEAEGKQKLDAAKLAEDARQFDIETMAKADAINKRTAVDLTKIEAQHGQDIEGSLI
jgi:hypothetical protein